MQQGRRWRMVRAVLLMTLLLAVVAMEAAVVANVRAAQRQARLVDAAASAEPLLRLASLELPRQPVPAVPPVPRGPSAEELAAAMLPPMGPLDSRPPPSLPPDAADTLAGMLPAPQALEHRAGPSLDAEHLQWLMAMLPSPGNLDVRPGPDLPRPVEPLLEPFMEANEDWVVGTRLHRHPGIRRVHFNANVQAKCLPSTLLNVLYDAAMRFGDVRVISGYRSPGHNRAVGGASRSLHLECRAIDFYIAGPGSGVLQWLIGRREVGGYKRYPFGSFHIDNGPRRTWGWPGRKRRGGRR